MRLLGFSASLAASLLAPIQQAAGSHRGVKLRPLAECAKRPPASENLHDTALEFVCRCQ
jgi:hypothetical protein